MDKWLQKVTKTGDKAKNSVLSIKKPLKRGAIKNL